MVNFSDLANGSYIVKAQVGGRRTSSSAAIVIDLAAETPLLTANGTGFDVTNNFPSGTYLTVYKDGGTDPMKDKQL